MAIPRKTLVSLSETPWYHCVSRCVRRAFLCGVDPLTGVNYEKRRQQIEHKLLFLGQVFAIDIAAYAVMSNHYHVVLHVDQKQAAHWSQHEVIMRWHAVFKGSPQSNAYLEGQDLSNTQNHLLQSDVQKWRERLCNISWFMRVVNEYIARQANAEDGCTGRFWEGRFKSQALLDEQALIACMTYVDLNPIRAKEAQTPETSCFTSAKKRIRQAQISQEPEQIAQQPSSLLPFVGKKQAANHKGIPFTLTDYLSVLDWNGRIVRADKPGAIPRDMPPILERLELEPKHWIKASHQFEGKFKRLVGCTAKLVQVCKALGLRRTPGLATAQLLG